MDLMGSENFVKWHRIHCQHWNYTGDTACSICNGIAYLDNQLDGLDQPAYFEDYHYGSCWLKNCIYCKGFVNLVRFVEEANEKIKENDDHTYGHVMDQPDGWKVEACQAIECKAVIKSKFPTISGAMTEHEPVPWWTT